MPLPPGTDALFTASPGFFGNAIVIELVYVEGAPNLVITVAQDTITLTLGTTSGIQNLSWDAIAVLVNANADAAALVTMEGQTADQNIPSFTVGGDPLQGGSAGLGLGQFYAADSAPPPPGPTLTLACPVNNQAFLGSPYSGQLIAGTISS